MKMTDYYYELQDALAEIEQLQVELRNKIDEIYYLEENISDLERDKRSLEDEVSYLRNEINISKQTSRFHDD
jgi:chromosome segregation ATPase